MVEDKQKTTSSVKQCKHNGKDEGQDKGKDPKKTKERQRKT